MKEFVEGFLGSFGTNWDNFWNIFLDICKKWGVYYSVKQVPSVSIRVNISVVYKTIQRWRLESACYSFGQDGGSNNKGI